LISGSNLEILLCARLECRTITGKNENIGLVPQGLPLAPAYRPGHAVLNLAPSSSPSSRIIRSLNSNLRTLPLAVNGNSATNLMYLGTFWRLIPDRQYSRISSSSADSPALSRTAAHNSSPMNQSGTPTT